MQPSHGAPGESSPATRLIAATPAMLGQGAAPDRPEPETPVLPAGGLEPPEVLAWIDRTAHALEAAIGVRGVWLIAEGDEAVGIISIKGPPRDGVAAIGYGVVPERRGRGHATRAVALLAAEAERIGLELCAETAPDNVASQRVLERNGFARDGERIDPDEGPLFLWRRRDASAPRALTAR